MTAVEPRPAAPTTVWSSPVTSFYLLGGATGILVLIGLAVVLSSSSIDSIQTEGNPYSLFASQAIYLGIGLVGLAVVSRVPVDVLKRLAPFALATAIVLLGLVALTPLGLEEGGNTNWLNLGPIAAQPSEAAKLALALYLGVALAHLRGRLVTIKDALVPAGLIAAMVIALVLWGNDLGTATVMLALTAAAFWTAGLPKRFFALGAIVAIGILAALVMAREAIYNRFAAWLSPDCDPTAACFQVTHGQWALASGGIWGLGPGLSREKWSYLPKAHNDFIFAIVGEEFGLVGAAMVLLAIAMLAIAVNRIVRRHTDIFVQITAAAIGAWLVGQACLNIAVVLRLAPVTGVPLPLVSTGGSSLIMSLIGVGVLLAFARSEPGAREAFRARRSVVRRSLAVLQRGRGRG